MAVLLKGTLTLPRVSFGRKLGALAVAAILLCMPLFYLGAIGAVLAAIFWLLMSGSSSALPSAAIGLLLLVCAFLFVGLIKPLVEPQARTVVQRPLDLNREPQLSALLNALGEQLGSPLATDVQIECSTRLYLLPRQKRLVIGLPLLACLDVTQFAGLLASQLAPFRRGAGGSLMNFVSGVNHWLWRAVYGKSRFDQWLVIVAERPHFHAAKLLLPVGALKYVTRVLLFVPMFVANTIAAEVVRRTLLDSDLIAARLVGARSFTELLERREQIDFTWEGVLAELDYLHRNQSLPNSLPQQLALRMLDMTPELHLALSETVNKPEERPFDSQLTRPQRIAAVTASAPSVGILDSTAPAYSLLTSYDEQARRLTWDYYVLRFGPERLKTALQPVAAPLAAR